MATNYSDLGNLSASSSATSSAVNSTYDITIQYSGDPTYQAVFTTAANIWHQIIIADVPDVNSPTYSFIDDLLIAADVSYIDGVGNILGQAGPDEFRSATYSYQPDHGSMTFDSADVVSMNNNGTLLSVVLHEMGHVLGLGTLWDALGLRSGHNYTGANALAQYRILSGNASATSVPLESGGGPGTMDSHWSEATFDTELMTGYAEAAGTFMPISRLTIGALRDLDYTVDLGAADPYFMPGHSVDDDISGNSRTTSSVAVGGTRSGTLNYFGDRDWFAFSVTTGRNYTIQERGSPTGSGTLSDPYLRLYDSSGNFITFNDDANGTSNSLLTFTAAYTGTYYLSAGAYGDGYTGTYQVSITLVPTALNPGPEWKIVGAARFNADSMSDLVLQHDNGTISLWYMNGSVLISGGAIANYPGSDWRLKGTGDFNADSKGDLLLQNTNGTIAVWELNGAGGLLSGGAISNYPGADWKAKGTGNFDTDGKSDIVLQNDNGTIAVWLMDGFTLKSGGAISNYPGPDWAVKGTGDFDADGKADIVLQNTAGTIAVWLMNGFSLKSGGAISNYPGPDWSVVGVNDYDADGKSDLVLQSTNGTIAVWLMNGFSLTSGGAISNYPGPDWRVRATGDFDADGKADIALQNTDGSTAIWLMNGFTLKSGGGISTGVVAFDSSSGSGSAATIASNPGAMNAASNVGAVEAPAPLRSSAGVDAALFGSYIASSFPTTQNNNVAQPITTSSDSTQQPLMTLPHA